MRKEQVPHGYHRINSRETYLHLRAVWWRSFPLTCPFPLGSGWLRHVDCDPSGSVIVRSEPDRRLELLTSMPSLRAWLCLLALILHASLPVVVVAEQGRNKP